MRLLLIFFFLLSLTTTKGQKIDNTASFREPQSDRYFRVNYDNDYFAAQDKNYTQGYSFELVTPGLVRNPINKIFLSLKDDVRKAGVVFEHIGFTPTSYEKIEVQEGDRPFTATALLKSFVISTSKESGQRLSSHFSFGVMGPAAKGEEIQAGIHRLTGDRNPLGWRNQVENHFVFNYGVDYEKELLNINKLFGLYANASAKIGNLFTNAALGFNTTFGLINSTYDVARSKKFLLYGYMQPLVTIVAYDGTLQGALFNEESIYIIPSSDVSRVVGQVNYGIVLQTKSLYLEYSRSSITKEITTLSSASWGGVKIGFRI